MWSQEQSSTTAEQKKRERERALARSEESSPSLTLSLRPSVFLSLCLSVSLSLACSLLVYPDMHESFARRKFTDQGILERDRQSERTQRVAVCERSPVSHTCPPRMPANPPAVGEERVPRGLIHRESCYTKRELAYLWR